MSLPSFPPQLSDDRVRGLCSDFVSKSAIHQLSAHRDPCNVDAPAKERELRELLNRREAHRKGGGPTVDDARKALDKHARSLT
jgi:hypothetical protein